ncbi:hypothetical protein PG993_013967 [Apiospora rasikravindrae]|uniref:Uncharacterized protein n=1 Tax=Apiospora rasikravindrae TaxID=990691 RepID=A0ABR1RRQ1_9PEZI
MASPPSDALGLRSRDSSPRPTERSSSRRRPRLLRACATEPSITRSSACKGVMTSPNSCQRATDLLSRVAVSNAAASNFQLSSSPISTRSFGTDTSDKAGYHLEESNGCRLLPFSNPSGMPNGMVLTPKCTDSSGGYFSFPSFDTWDVGNQDEDKSFDSAT